MHPVGPHSQRIYWIRRVALIVIALVALIGLVFWIAGRGSGSDVDPAAADAPIPTPELTGVLGTTTPATSSEWSFDEPAGSEADLFAGSATSSPTTAHDDVPADAPSADADAGATDPDAAPTTTDADAGASDTGDADAQPAATGSPSATATPSTATTPTTDAGAQGTADADAESASPSNTPDASPTSSDDPPPASTVTEQETTTTTVTTTVTDVAEPTPSYDAQGRLICPDTSISVTAIGWSDEFPVGSMPRIGMSVKNVGDETCMRDISGTLQVYTVYTADGDRVWSTDDCFPGTGHEVHRFVPGSKADFTIVWAGTTSTPGCDTERVTVKPGSYKLVAQLGDITGKPMMFTMAG